MDRKRRRAATACALALLLPALVALPTQGSDAVPSGTFSASAPLAVARAGHTATLLPDGRILVIGGYGAGSFDGDDYLASAEIWDPVLRTFTATGSLAEARRSQTATLLGDGRVLVLGGRGQAGILASGELWDPVSGVFSAVGQLADARSGHAATLLPDGRVLIVGGYRAGGGILGSSELWDPTTNAFTTTGSLGIARTEFVASLGGDGDVLVVGGSGGPLVGGYLENGEYLASAERWDPGSGTFSPTGSLTEARSNATATTLSDGNVVVTGGYGPIGYPTGSVEVLDVASGTFSLAEPLADARAGHTATLLSDGRVLVAGGYIVDGTSLDSVEVIDATGRTVGSSGPMAEGRANHTATMLPDGSVLVIGGEDGYVVASTELWQP